MKKMITLSLAVMGMAAGATAQKKQTIHPSGNIIAKTVNVNSFDAIKAEGIYDLVLTAGDKESVRIEADDNMQDMFSVSNDGKTLVIGMPKLHDQEINIDDDDQHHHSLHWKVYVNYKTVKSLDLSVIGNTSGETAMKSDAFSLQNKAVGNIDLKISTGKLTIHNEGVGKMVLAGDATDAVIRNSGVGELDGEDLLVQTMNIDNSGVGHASVNVQKDLTVQQSFLGKVTNKGNAKKHMMEGTEM